MNEGEQGRKAKGAVYVQTQVCKGCSYCSVPRRTEELNLRAFQKGFEFGGQLLGKNRGA